jgi:hypothetical protein
MSAKSTVWMKRVAMVLSIRSTSIVYHRQHTILNHRENGCGESSIPFGLAGTRLRADRPLLVREEMDDVQLTPAQQRQAQLARLKGVSNGFDPTYTS